MSLILCTDTSTKACSAALIQDAEVISKTIIHEDGFSHAEQLHILLQKVMDEANIPWDSLDAVAIGKGPGSYTGLRIGVRAVKGICYARGIPLISIDTLRIMAAHAIEQGEIPSDALLRPMIDARRMEVYSASYSPVLALISNVKALVLDEQSFMAELAQGPVYFFGDGMEKCRHLFEGNENAFFIKEVIPAAWSMAALAHQAFEKKQFEDVAYFEPFYLKEFLAKDPKKLV